MDATHTPGGQEQEKESEQTARRQLGTKEGVTYVGIKQQSGLPVSQPCRDGGRLSRVGFNVVNC